MRLFLDTNVLYPTVMRQVLLGAAEAGFFQPLWSARVLEEWARAADRHGQRAIAEGEIALVKLRFPRAEVQPKAGDLARLWLPDPDDVHVLAAAISGSADGIVTMNAQDFPRHILAEEGLTRNDPDALLVGFAEAKPQKMAAVVATIRAEADRLSGEVWTTRGLLKKARLPRLGKRLQSD